VLRRYPVEKGLAEVIGYLSLAADDDKAMIDTEQEERIEIRDETGQRKWVRLPRVVFTR
jgi:hypothetical protein